MRKINPEIYLQKPVKKLRDKTRFRERVSARLKTNFFYIRFLSPFFYWFNNMPNTALALVILLAITGIMAVINYFTMPQIQPTQTSVMQVIADWERQQNILMILIICFMLKTFIMQNFERYRKRVNNPFKR